MANFYLAFDLELSIVPVLNKIDLPAAEPEEVAEQVQQASTISYCLRISSELERMPAADLHSYLPIFRQGMLKKSTCGSGL